MWKIKTDKGHFIQAVSNVSEEKLKEGSFIKANENLWQGHKFLNNIEPVEKKLLDNS